MTGQQQSGRVIVGLSGGVDSAVAAARLLQQGVEVHGLHMSNWDDDDGYCNAAEDFQEARRVCEHLDIPLHRVNFSREYRDRVFAYFLDEYRRGRTPNPDVLCNREIKFGAFLQYARRLGATSIATGHYARAESRRDGVALCKARDANKDQSYFLHAVPQAALAATQFPLGLADKAAVRAEAKALGLRNHARKDSTGICFIGERPFRRFLSQYLPAQPGVIRNLAGERLGTHQGLMYYTLGQRQGLGLGGRQGADEAPWYVAAKHLDSNELIVVQGHDHPALQQQALTASDVHWIRAIPTALTGSGTLRCAAKTRYRQIEQSCTIRDQGAGTLLVNFDQPQRAMTPGQFVVFYDGEECLGGSVIDSVAHDSATVGATPGIMTVA